MNRIAKVIKIIILLMVVGGIIVTAIEKPDVLLLYGFLGMILGFFKLMFWMLGDSISQTTYVYYKR